MSRPRGQEDRVKPEDEVSFYRWSATFAEEARQGVKGRAIAWRSA